MDFRFFESMTRTAAERFLSDYLRVEEAAWQETRLDVERAGISCDFSVGSVPGVMKWILKHVHVVRVEPDIAVPSWIRDTSSYQRGLFDLNEPSEELVIRASYYCGAAFVAHYANLSWGVGLPGFAQENMPVVTGFEHKLELAPVMVTENLFRRVLGGDADESTIDVAVEYWAGMVKA